VKITRAITATLATVLAVGGTAVAASPAQAAVTRSFSFSGESGSVWGTVKFTNFTYTADVYIYRDSGLAITFKICAYQFLNNGAPAELPNTCRQASNGGSAGSTRHTSVSASTSIAKIGMATPFILKNGALDAAGDWIYA
jgi:hypothetical protein